MELLIVVDMQKDFIDGALGTAEAQAIVAPAAEKINAWREKGGMVLFTRDTHDKDYLLTQEGQLLPVEHCQVRTPGWQIDERLPVNGAPVVDKPTFGSLELIRVVRMLNPTAITLIGICTDICVISNAMLLKAGLPEIPITVDAACCAGVTPERHNNALAAMAACQIHIIND